MRLPHSAALCRGRLFSYLNENFGFQNSVGFRPSDGAHVSGAQSNVTGEN